MKIINQKTQLNYKNYLLVLKISIVLLSVWITSIITGIYFTKSLYFSLFYIIVCPVISLLSSMLGLSISQKLVKTGKQFSSYILTTIYYLLLFSIFLLTIKFTHYYYISIDKYLNKNNIMNSFIKNTLLVYCISILSIIFQSIIILFYNNYLTLIKQKKYLFSVATVIIFALIFYNMTFIKISLYSNTYLIPLIVITSIIISIITIPISDIIYEIGSKKSNFILKILYYIVVFFIFFYVGFFFFFFTLHLRPTISSVIIGLLFDIFLAISYLQSIFLLFFEHYLIF